MTQWLASNGWTVVTSELGYIAKSFPELSEEQRQQTGDEDAEGGHARSSEDLANRPMIADARDQFSASAFSCFRPARLMV